MGVLAQVSEEQEGWVTAFSLHAIEAIVGKNHRGIPLLTQFLDSILTNPFLHVYYTSVEEELVIVKQMAKSTLDFDDALQYYVAHKNQWKLVSLDRDFRKIKGLEIIFPSETGEQAKDQSKISPKVAKVTGLAKSHLSDDELRWIDR